MPKMKGRLYKYIKKKAQTSRCEEFVSWFVQNCILKNCEFGRQFLADYRVDDLTELYSKLK